MRQIVLDTETTGLEPWMPGEDGEKKPNHRIIEVACIEIVDGIVSDKYFHAYFNPGRAIDEGAKNIHGITEEFLKDKPLFSSRVDEFIEFVKGTNLIIHNAPFDVKFLDAELEWSKRPGLDSIVSGVTDTLAMARKCYPGHKNTLDALCDRLGIDRSSRDLHGALVDTRILADMYMMLNLVNNRRLSNANFPADPEFEKELVIPERKPRVLMANDMELEAHRSHLNSINSASRGSVIWDSGSSPGPG